jgi:putative ABC transport system permease protein
MFLSALVMAFKAIIRNALRSFLTILGIVIGVASVVALVTIGEGASQQVVKEIESLGHNLLTARPGADFHRGPSTEAAPGFELDDIRAIQREISGAQHVAPSSSKMVLIVNGNANWSTSVTGTTNAYLPCRGYSVEKGRKFSATEENGGNPACLLGATVAKELFEASEPLGERVRVGKIPCPVIGVLAKKGESAMGMDQDDVILMPIKAFQKRISGDDKVGNISISVADGRSTTLIKTQIESLLRERRRIRPSDADNFVVRDIQELSSAMQGTTQVMTALLSAIAAVSLLVGGIGIMNIMLVSVTERTREIGIRLAIGARGREILLQFLVEASVLSGIGGIVGLALGFSGAKIIGGMIKVPFVAMPEIGAIAFGFSVLVGAIFGYLPARRAARLNPVEALRYE